MSGEERSPNPLMQQINGQSAAMGTPFSQNQAPPQGPLQPNNTAHPENTQSRVLAPDSSPDNSMPQSSLPPGGFMLPDQNGSAANFSIPSFSYSQGRPPPEAMLDPAYANGRSDGQPPAKRRLVSLGDRSQSPATDIPGSSTTSLPRGAPAISRSSSSNTLVSDVNNLSFLSQSNSATGSPAPGGSPAPADFLAFFNTDTNTNPAEQTATPPTRNLSAPRPQQDDAETEYQRFKQTFPYETDARVRQAWEESGRQADKATTILCGSNPLLQGAAPSSNGSSAPSPVPPQSAPSGRPPSGQAGLNNSWNGMMPMGGSPPLQGHTGPPQYAQLPPQQQQRPQYPQGMHQQHPQSHMGGYPQQRPGFPHSGPPYMPSQGAPAMPAQSASSFYPGSQLYRGPAQGMPGQPAAAPRYPQPGQPPYRQAPGQPIVTLRQQPAIDPRAMIQQNLNPSNGAHVAQYRAMMGQAGRPGGGHMDGQMQRMQMLQANPNYTQQQRQQQEKAAQERNRAEHQARVHAHQQAMARTMQQNKASTHGKNDVSKTVAKFRPPAGAAAAAAAKRAKRKHADSDSEDGGNWSEGDNGAQYEEYVNVEKEAEAVQFLNTCRPEELPDYTACSAEAAQAIVQLRPFESPDDIRAKLKATKGISNKLFDSLVDVFEAYEQVDRTFHQCEQYARELAHIMRIWSGASKQARMGKPEDTQSLLPGQAPPEQAVNDIETGVHLVELDEAALDFSLQPNAPRELQIAFHNYLREKPPGVPDNIKLKGYQMLGLNWLRLLHSKGLSCILADEMGLGKTCQVITFLAHLKATNQPGPHLVVVPSSTLDNWLREFGNFAPDMKVFAYYGSQAAREELRADYKAQPELDVIVTTYNMAAGNADDKKFLKKMGFKTCVYDEGHQLKNSESKKYKDLMELRVQWRLLLTGTPLQNNLTELISLLSFILPTVFQPAQDGLRAIFKVPPAAQQNMLSQRRINSAKKVMTPFLLRRKKHQVLQELPDKHEHIVRCEMTDNQKALYRASMQKSKRYLEEDKGAEPLPDEVGKKGRGRPKAVQKQLENSSNILMDLRKAANHPMLFRRLYDDAKIAQMARDCLKELEFSDRDQNYIEEDLSIMTDYELHRFVQPYKHLGKYALANQEWMQSGKVEWLTKNILEMRERGDRILLFSQFTQVLDLLEEVLETLQVKYLKLTGQTNVAERQDLVDQYYEDPEITVFLLSTRAGGLGLNLAAANVVILHDQDFNPHNDKQAEDRAWRIGQTRDVNVIRLVMKDTIEEDILALATTKLTLDSELSKIDGDEPSANGGSKEGEEVTEKKVKNSLLKQIRAKLEQTEGEEAQALATQMAQQPQQAQSNERGAKTEPSEVRVEA